MTARLFSIAGFCLAILLTWLVFGVLWWAPQFFAESYRAMGGDFPTPMIWMVWLAENGVPLLCALAYSLVLLWLCLRPKSWRSWVIAGMACLPMFWLACALVAVALPLQKCQMYWPDWPWEKQSSAAPSGISSGCKLD